MRKLVKISMAVAALFTVACTTDATEDLGVQLGGVDGDGQTTITLSLEESRTQLGEKAGEVYPLVWSDGDKISVNGIESGEAVINAGNAANASFAISGVSTPYAIAYPAAPAGQVLFADKQAYTSNTTFGKGVATMYAYSESGVGLQLNHLTGVLKIGVVGSAKLTMAQISTVDRTPIAGAFELDFTTGELKSTTSSKEVIEYSFGEGVQLSEEPTYIHVAVPAGVYDELYVTLYDVDGGVMYATVKADESKPLSVGKVREFTSNINYAATDQVFVVKDVATLKAFAEAAPTLEKDVLFVADVDMSGEAWTPIEGYAKTVRGNGYSIKGLTAPLFGTTNASFKGLHLREVNIEVNGLLHSGALACSISATDTISPIVEHCSVSGTINVNNETLTIPEGAAETRVNVGGVVGVAYGVVFESCRNSAKITITKPLADAQAIQFTQSFGGIVGRVHVFTKSDATTITSYVNKSTNSGNLTFGHSTAVDPYLYMGGILGLSTDDNVSGHVSNSINTGKLSVGNKIYSLYLAGIVGYAKCDTNQAALMPVFANNINRGEIEVKENTAVANVLNIGGIGGRTNSCAHSNSHNYGAINILKGAVASNTIDIGGVVAYIIYANTASGYKIAFNLSDCSNNAPLNLGIGRPSGTANTIRIGGVAGYTQARCYRNVNSKEGTITISGDYTTNGGRATASNEYKNGSYVIGGLYGYKTEGRIYGGKNHADIIVNGKWTEKSTKTISQLRVAGIVGYLSTNLDNSEPFEADGKITFSGTSSCEVTVGGLIGITYATQGGERCDTDIEVSGTCSGGLVVGGLAAIHKMGYTDAEYHGTINITESAQIGTRCSISGCLGNVVDWNATSYAVRGLRNYGNITMAGTATSSAVVSGCLGTTTIDSDTKPHVCSDLINYGNLTVTGTAATIYLSGVAHRCSGNATSLINGDAKDSTKGNIYFSGVTSAKTRLYLSGVTYDFDMDATSCANYGAITMAGKTGSTFHCGGMSAAFINAGKTWTECNNYGKITLSGEVGSSSIEGSDSGADTFVGGITELVTASEELRTFVRCGNYGDLEFTDTFKCAGSLRSAGFYARQENVAPVVMEDCLNTGNVIMNGTASARVSGNCRLAGGIATLSASTVTIKGSFVNSGNVAIGGKNAKSSVVVAGVFGYHISCQLLNGGEGEAKIINTGKVSYTGGSVGFMYVGGIFGMIGTSGVIDSTIKLVNTGDVVAHGSYGNTDAENVAYVGGVVGSNLLSFANAESYCNISGYWINDGNLIPYTGVGIVSGTPRSETYQVTNCKVGGTFSEYNLEDNIEKINVVDSSNFYNYIYGSGEETVWTGTDNYDGCTFLSVAPTI